MTNEWSPRLESNSRQGRASEPVVLQSFPCVGERGFGAGSTIRETLPASTDTQAAAPTSSMNSATKARFLFRGLFLYRLLRTKSVIRVVNHDRCDLPSGVGLLHQVDDAGPLQFFSVGLATYGDAPGDHGGCAQPFEVKVD